MVLLLVLCLVAGAATLGHGWWEGKGDVPDGGEAAMDIQGVRLGMSQREVEALAGQPNSTKASRFGSLGWHYESRENPTGGVEWVAFGKNGQATKISGSSLRMKGQPAFTVRTTSEEIVAALGPPTSQHTDERQSPLPISRYDLTREGIRLDTYQLAGGARMYELRRARSRSPHDHPHGGPASPRS